MSFFDLLFPDWATASHLRKLTEQSQQQDIRSRISQARKDRLQSASKRKSEERIEALEKELNQASLVIEALIEKLEEKKIASRAELQELITEIDGRDGMVDGKITPLGQQSCQTTKSIAEEKKSPFIFSEEK